MNYSDMGHYVCSWCNISFGELSILHLHMGVHIEIVGPKDTSSDTPESSILSEVREDSDDKGEYHCKVCQKYFNNLGIFTFHLRAHYEGKRFQCTICGSVFAMKSAVYNHVCSHISEKLCKCRGGHVALQGKEDQPRIFESADDLNKCGVCDGGYSTKKRLDRHALKHVGHFSCSICKRSYQGQAEYEKHMECHAYVMFFRCDTCFETFHDRKKRDDHMKTHPSSLYALKDGKFACDLSDISENIVSKKLKSGCLPVDVISTVPNSVGPSVSKNLLQSKKRSILRNILKDSSVSSGTVVKGSNKEKLSPRGNLINTSEIISENLTTPDSQKEYLVKAEKGRNMFILNSRACEGSGKYECKLCYKMWEEKHAFWQHLLRHSEDVPHTCKICVKIFEDGESWKNHKEQKCGCALCGKLMQRIDYVTHNKVCPVNNPFKCLVCFKRFSSSDLFRDHMTSHSKEKSCRCKVCGEVLLLKYEAERHNKMHKKQSVDPVSTMLQSGDEEDLLSVSPSEENLSCKIESEETLQIPYVSDEARDIKVPLSSIEIENDIVSRSLKTVSAITVKEEPLPEDKNIFSETVLETNVEQSYVVIVTDEVNDFHHDESVVDPLA